ncbi:phosphohistidine phosphatase SixA [Thiohalorhabdus sp.]|uniref:phosphohistidine phosphatase SixA n=1 Tax=Thiohalorhabdus sp. TaxID=3094134 RepID=UPI002FC33E38
MLFLVQHGEATTKDQNPDRPLTERGEVDIRNLGQFLEQAGVRVETVLESGKLRARQTAEILSEYLTPGLAPEEMAGLGATQPVGPVIDKIRERDRPIMLVSHMPLVGALAGELVAGAEDRPPVAFRPGTAVALEWAEEQGWQVAWMIRPELLR